MVSDLLFADTTEGRGATASTLFTYTEKFNELFPYYLSLGMTEEQYWDRDSTLVIHYRKADELRTNRKNQEMWLQGAYIYDAMSRVSPLLHAFAKKGTKPMPYLTEPYTFDKKQKEMKESKEEKKVFDKGFSMMEAFMVQNNKKFERK